MRSDYPSIIGKEIHGMIDRPVGSMHPKYPNICYPLNYGYAKGYLAEDGEAQDVYILRVDLPLKTFCGKVIAVYRREEDIEDKWIVSLDEREYSDTEILTAIHFQEQYFPGKLLR